MMKILIPLYSLLLLSVSITSQAAEPMTQQQKMARCNEHASTQLLKGDERKSFMSSCLKKESNMAAMTPQQMKMKNCNSQASSQALKGEARNNFLSGCLKKG